MKVASEILNNLMVRSCEGFEHVAAVRQEPHRWQTPILVVFRKEGEDQLYGATFMSGNTESQESEWLNEDHELMVECDPVVAEEKVVTCYRDGYLLQCQQGLMEVSANGVALCAA